jgi:uncharacterized damage-inducible protein DinB
MTNLDFCRARRKAEIPAFVRVLRALPQEGLGYRPDPKARTAGELAWLMAAEEAALVSLLDTGVIDWKAPAPPARVSEIVSAYERNSAAVNRRLDRLDEAGWHKSGRFLMGGGAAWEQTVGDFVWLFLFDAIHHRGQLSAYLRPMGGRVPSIYGPSGDDPGR